MANSDSAIRGLIGGGRVTYHFTFSFHLSFGKLRPFGPANLSDAEEALKEILSQAPHDGSTVDRRESQESGYAPYFNVRTPFVEADFLYISREGPPVIRDLLSFSEPTRRPSLPVSSIGGHFLVLPSGAGVFRVSVVQDVTTDAEASIDTILSLSDLVPSVIPDDFKRGCLPRIPVGTEYLSLPELFAREVRSLSKRLQAEWTCDPSNGSSPLRDGERFSFQCPFPSVIIEGYHNERATIDSIYNKGRDDPRNPDEMALRGQVAALASRNLFWRTVNLDYAYQNAKLLDSCFPSSNVFLNVHPRGLLCILDKSWAQSPYKSVLTSAIHQTVDLLRTQQHSLVIANYMLATHLERVYEQIFESLCIQGSECAAQGAQDAARWIPSLPSLSEILDETADLRRQVYLLLDHPSEYRKAAGAFGELHQKGARTFGLPALQDLVLTRLAELGQASQDSENLETELTELRGASRFLSWIRWVFVVLGGAALAGAAILKVLLRWEWTWFSMLLTIAAAFGLCTYATWAMGRRGRSDG